MGKPFRNIYLCSTHDFPPDVNDKIKGWVESAGGRYTREISQDVTHLLASPKAWKRNYPLVREARHMRTIHVVKFAWLEDSLTRKSRRPLDETTYQWEQRKITKIPRMRKTQVREDAGEDELKKGLQSDSRTRLEQEKVQAGRHVSKKPRKEIDPKTDQTRADETHNKCEGDQLLSIPTDKVINISAKELDAACTEFVKDMQAAGYRPFVDQTGFVYLVTLVRKDVLKNRLEKHRLKVRYAHWFSTVSDPSHQISPMHDDIATDVSTKTLRVEEAVEESEDPASRNGGTCCAKSVVTPVPVPLYYNPSPQPYCTYPIVATSLPRSLTSSNPLLRVHIPNPWAQGFQMFESEAATSVGTASNGAAAKTYACYTIYSRRGHRHVTPLAPPGSSFDFAWEMFRKFFKNRVGVDWKGLDTAAANQGLAGNGGSPDSGGQEDARHHHYQWVGPSLMKPGINVTQAVIDDMDDNCTETDTQPATSIPGRDGKPSITMLSQTPTVDPKARVGTKAWAPLGEW